MNWIDEVHMRLKRKNKILFAKDSELLTGSGVAVSRTGTSGYGVVAFEFAAETVANLEEKYPDERRPREALEAVPGFGGRKKSRCVRPIKILSCLPLQEIACKEDIAMCHAVGQACAVVHTAGHAIGYPIYDLTSIIYRYGIEDASKIVEERKQTYINRLLYWKEHLDTYKGEWAEFMRK